MERALLRGLWITAFFAPGAIAVVLAARSRESATATDASADARTKPGLAGVVDEFHPDRAPRADGTRPDLPTPAYGGRVILHTDVLPKHLNVALSNSAYARRVLTDVHETLLRWDPDRLELVPDLCTSIDVEDALVKQGGRGKDDANVVVGRVSERDGRWIVAERSGETSFSKADVQSIERGTVFTVHLRDGVTWHDGHPFDADDVVFSWSIYGNQHVACDERRFQYLKILSAVKLDRLTVRFTYENQYFNARASVGDLFILPRHLYDPTDPEHEHYDPEFHASRRAKDPNWKPTELDVGDCVNTNAHNRDWVGLGAYRVAGWTSDSLELVRYDKYFDSARAGYVDVIRWRAIKELSAAFQALLAGEIDFLNTITTDDYFGDAIKSETFTKRYYKGTHRASQYWFIGWNMLRPQLADARVRRALAHLANLEAFRVSYYRELAQTVTGPFLPGSPACDASLKPYAYDPREAERILTDAGWIDRDGDGVLDKDGVKLAIELLIPPANPAASGFAAKFQEDCKKVGVQIDVRPLEFTTLNDRKTKRDFDAVQLGWALPPESDPEQAWHSRWGAPGKSGGNFVGLQDAGVDALIEAGQRELDPVKRAGVWRQLHARLLDLSPYLFCYAPLRKFAMNRAIHGFSDNWIDPNFVVREWYYAAATPGTRPTLADK